MSDQKVNIHESWYNVLKEEFDKPYFHQLKSFLKEEKLKYEIYPPGNQIFSAFDKTPFDQVKVVILGQDPYHGPGQANGLSFSVAPGIKQPPSLKNIFKEIQEDLQITPPESGDLGKWAGQGVFLLNAVLTVRKKSPASHQNQGWETFTDKVIQTISDHKEGIIFMLWGNYARKKAPLIDTEKHQILEAAHPSPFSFYKGYQGCQHFSKANELLQQRQLDSIDWDLND